MATFKEACTHGDIQRGVYAEGGRPARPSFRAGTRGGIDERVMGTLKLAR